MKTITLIFSILIILIVSMFPPPLEAQVQSQQVAPNLSVSNALPPLLVATEEEVGQFFVNYIERYTQKDLDGFLSLFSLRAVQNRKNGWEGIREIYADFFNQSQEIHYSMDDTRIEIYQNGVMVEARYEVDQTLKKRGKKKVWRGPIRWTLVKEDGALKILSLDYQF